MDSYVQAMACVVGKTAVEIPCFHPGSHLKVTNLILGDVSQRVAPVDARPIAYLRQLIVPVHSTQLFQTQQREYFQPLHQCVKNGHSKKSCHANLSAKANDMKSRAMGLKMLYGFLALGMLLYILRNVLEKDADIVFFAGMMALTFPSGMIVSMVMAALLYIVLTVFGVQFDNSIPFYLVVWTVYVIAGYFQWFMVLPKIRRKRDARLLDAGTKR